MRQHIRRVGVICYRTALRTVSLLIDRALNVETTAQVNLADLRLEDPNRVNYEGSSWSSLHRILRREDVSPDDVFLDLGSGKGRALLLAARYPFRRVIGVEISERLAEIARRNVESCRAPLRCRNIEIVSEDVMKYAIPDDVTVLYLYNPFHGHIFDAMVESIVASVDRRPRTVRLIYAYAKDHDRLVRTSPFRLVRLAKAMRPNRQERVDMSIRLYRLEPTVGIAGKRGGAS